jgi:hypothetical protein
MNEWYGNWGQIRCWARQRILPNVVSVVRFFQRARAEARTHFQRDGHRLEPRGRRRDVEDYDSRLVRRRRMMHLEGERLPGSI